MNAVSLQHLWDYLQGLSLTDSNKKWLSERLIEKPSINKAKAIKSTDSIEQLSVKTTPYTIEELNARIDDAEKEIEHQGGKTFDILTDGFKQELTWLK